MGIKFSYLKQLTAKTVLASILGFLALVLFVGCAGNFGRIHWDEDVTRAFEANQVEPSYNFYQYTIGMRVFAIVGLDPKLELQSRMWRELATDTEEFKVATSRMWDNYTQLPEYPRGAIIMDPDGEKAGVYFSSLRFVSIKFKPENQVMVMLDTTFLWGPDEIRTP